MKNGKIVCLIIIALISLSLSKRLRGRKHDEKVVKPKVGDLITEDYFMYECFRINFTELFFKFLKNEADVTRECSNKYSIYIFKKTGVLPSLKM